MLTLNHVAPMQAALFAACPRPHALVPATSAAVQSSRRPAVAAWSVAAVSAGFGSVAVVRPWADERPAAGYGLRRRGTAGATADLFRFAAAIPAGAAMLGSTTTQHQQDKQNRTNLTDRREPRTWRPPH